jgi:GH24 family phage-related lysozyme (muramidase)
MKYKRSIDCSNPKGFGQKAHCRARKLRQAGKHTKSTPVKECYKEALQELLKEQDSSMAMGALKQLNSDAKELEIMLQPNTQLEDWVKSKLNLAGEYLDDVYHHLDHFGPDGRKLDEELNELDYTGGVGIHEFAIFFQKASDEDEKQMNHCLKSNNVSCVKSLIQKVTGMTMDKINETLSDEKVVQKYVEYAANSIRYLKELEVIKKSYRRKDDIAKSIRDSAKNNTIDPLYITKSAVDSILIGLGKRTQYSTLSEKDKKVAVELEKLIPVALTHNDGILVKIVDLYESKNLDEDFKKTLASLGLAGLTALGAMTSSAAQPAKQSVKQSAQTVQKSTVSKDASALKSSEVKLLGGKLSDYIANWEGKKNKVYKDSAGLPTIGIGHYLTNNQEDRQLFNSLFGNSVDYNKILNGTQELDDNQIEKLFNVDVKIKEKLAGKKISGFGSLPQYIKNAIISGLYRGDLGPKTIGFINSGDWNKASVEYLNHKNAKTGPSQIQRRMKTNALAFSHYAKQFAQK